MSYKWESDLYIIEPQCILVQLENYISIYKDFTVFMAKLIYILVQILANVNIISIFFLFSPFPVFISLDQQRMKKVKR